MKTKLVSSTIEAFVKRVHRSMINSPKVVIAKEGEETEPKEKKMSKGQLFRIRYGFSKTFKRNMQKHGFDPFDESQRKQYRKHRNLGY